MKLLIALAALAVGTVATAAPLTFTGSFSIDHYGAGDAGPGLIAQISDDGLHTLDNTAPGDGTFSFTLNDGPGRAFRFFTISSPEEAIDADDYVPREISAAFNFTSHAFSGTPTVTGNTYAGLTRPIPGTPPGIPHIPRNAGFVEWDNQNDLQPSSSDFIFNFGNGGILTARVYGATFPFDFDPSVFPGQDVTIGFFLTKRPTEVPEPAALGLLGLGVASVALGRRRKR